MRVLVVRVLVDAVGIELESLYAPSEPAGEILSARQRTKDLLNQTSSVRLVDAVGIEPTTCRLRAECSAS
jgi:hypothetical protein